MVHKHWYACNNEEIFLNSEADASEILENLEEMFLY